MGARQETGTVGFLLQCIRKGFNVSGYRAFAQLLSRASLEMNP